MANPEHIDHLLQGAEHWNQWRQLHQDIQPDFSGSHLDSINLDGADLSEAAFLDASLAHASLKNAKLNRAQLLIAKLDGADLSEAMLIEANLVNAKLRKANLKGASLLGADARGADLSNANLSYSDLGATNFGTAHLAGTDLSQAFVVDTIFAFVDLSETKGLADIRHMGPSRVELYTVTLPQEGSALHFLRGTGVPEEWITLYRTQTMRPLQHHSVFISYSSKDDALAHRLHADLQSHGVRCWFAPEDLKIGDKIRPRIDEAIHLQDKLLLILSAFSVASDWVEHEVEMALAKERKEQRMVLFPIRVDGAILNQEDHGWPALIRHQRHIGDFTNWNDPEAYQRAFRRLLRDLKKADKQ
jgi:hypothetical protein